MKLLIVDDSPADRELVVRKLTPVLNGAQFVQIGRRDAFEAALEQDDFDAVITDYHLQWSDGLQVLQQVRQRRPNMPVLLLTESGSEEVAVEGMKAGLSDYVLKRHLERLPIAMHESLEKADLRRRYDEATTQLRLSEERYRAVSELSSDFAYAFRVEANGEAVLEWITEAFRHISGYNGYEVVGSRGWMDLIHPDDWPVVRQSWERLLAGEPQHSEVRLWSSDDTLHRLEVSARPVWDEAEGRVVRVYGAATDVTARRDAEEALQRAHAELETRVEERTAELAQANHALRESEETARALLNSFPGFAALVDTECTLLSANAAAAGRLGVGAHELAGAHVLDLLPPSSAETWRTCLQEVTRTGQAVHFERRHNERFVNHSVQPVLDASGRVTRLALFAQDVTEYRQAEADLRRLAAIVEAMPDMVSTARPDGKVLYFNRTARRVLGIPEQANLSEVTIPAGHPDWANALIQDTGIPTALRDGIWEGETAILRHDGSKFPAEQVILAHRAPDGGVEYLSTIARNISERKEAEIERERLLLEAQAYTEELQVANEQLEADAEELHVQSEELRHQNEELIRVQTELETERLRYLDLFEMAPDGYLVTNLRGQIREANRAAGALLGAEPAFLAGTPLSLFFSEADRRQFGPRLARYLQDQSPQRWEANLHSRAQQVVPVLLYSTPLYGEGGRLIGLRWLLHDISEIKAAQAARERLLGEVERQAAELDAVFSALTDAVVVYDAAGTPVRANPAAIAAYGFDPAHVTQPAILEKLTIRRPDGRPVQAEELPSQRARRGETVTDERYVFANAERRDLTILASAAPLRNGTRVVGAVAVWHDVTELQAARQRLEQLNGELEVQAEELLLQNRELEAATRALEAQRTQLDAIIANAPEGIVVADAQCRVVLTNPAADQIYARPVPYGEDFESHVELALHHPDGTPCHPRDLPLTRAALDGETPRNVELDIVWPDGQRRNLLVNAAPICDREGQRSGAVGVFQDITQRKQTEFALQQRNRDLGMLNRLGRDLGATLDLQQVLERVLAAVQEIVPAAGSAVWLWDEERPGHLLRRAAFYPNVDAPLPETRLGPGEGIAGWVAQHAESTFVPDVTQDAHFRSLVDAPAGLRVDAVLAVPLRVRNTVIGVLEVTSPSQASFNPQDMELVETLAASAASAIENARLLDRARQAAAEAERNRLARELHDAVSQTLFSASIIAESLPRLWEKQPDKVRRGLVQLHGLAQGALAEMRTLLLELRPNVLAETDLGDLLQQLSDALASRSRVSVNVQVDGECRLPPEVQIALYRITQEALNNVAKHARATRASVDLYSRPEQVELCIRDDGRGFDPTHIPPSHLGLSIMRERAQSIGAEVDIASQAGQGAQVRVVWPRR